MRSHVFKCYKLQSISFIAYVSLLRQFVIFVLEFPEPYNSAHRVLCDSFDLVLVIANKTLLPRVVLFLASFVSCIASVDG